MWDVVVLIAGLVLYCFSRLELRGNYLIGAVLVFCWLALWFSFWVAPSSLVAEFLAFQTK